MSAKFDKLKNDIARGYEKKGMPRAKAQEIGKKVAGKIARKKGMAPGGRNYKGK